MKIETRMAKLKEAILAEIRRQDAEAEKKKARAK